MCDQAGHGPNEYDAAKQTYGRNSQGVTIPYNSIMPLHLLWILLCKTKGLVYTVGDFWLPWKLVLMARAASNKSVLAL